MKFMTIMGVKLFLFIALSFQSYNLSAKNPFSQGSLSFKAPISSNLIEEIFELIEMRNKGSVDQEHNISKDFHQFLDKKKKNLYLKCLKKSTGKKDGCYLGATEKIGTNVELEIVHMLDLDNLKSLQNELSKYDLPPNKEVLLDGYTEWGFTSPFSKYADEGGLTKCIVKEDGRNCFLEFKKQL